MLEVDARKPETWIRYKNIKGFCDGCFAGCCTLPVLVSAEELFHMGFLEFHEVEGPLKRVSQRLKSNGIIRSFNSKTRLFTLKRKKGNVCVFLNEDRLCTIYDRRPSVCRKFPESSLRPGYCPKKPKSE